MYTYTYTHAIIDLATILWFDELIVLDNGYLEPLKGQLIEIPHIFFMTDINSMAYYESHHDCIIVISLERKGTRFPEYDLYFHNGGPGFPIGGPCLFP